MVLSLLNYLVFGFKKLILFDKLVVVTGASSGIGLEITKELAKKGSKVILIARNENKLKEIIENIKIEYGNNQCYYISADLSKEEDLNNCLKEIGKISNDNGQYVEILVNCAGAGNWKFIEETSFKECNDMMSLPYFAAFNMTRLLLEPMLLHGEGTIVNINSPVSVNVWGGCIGYACSRWALKGFTECLRIDLRGTGVNVLEVIPGETKSEYFQHNGIGDDSFPLLSKFVPKVTVDQVAKGTIKAIENRKQKLILPLMLNVAKYFAFFPFSILLKYLLLSEKSRNRLIEIKLKQQQFKLKQQQFHNINNNKQE
ncbi:hypothetical protein DDB_G0270018 [Dictyostelium discoideum AX4]|uniref:Uncharacterized protein n=1 Tax=Dictyostelium discoideum TaxID=44689 RepID=Q55CK8_DICDI|nr:hypothetical protein DDB_G0270018 [Dictyostelium discoideum AX4]EAL72359.1 hypothetical protein DDB_G0270018 [Dictyostelium discoideum AX4]|eukprot:XP_646473.1 hypothetical protein DDB_G0270018 [Dictyostelium discoideum AX4]